MRDSYGREVKYLRVSVTDRCNLRCVYCMPEEGVPLLRHEDVLSFERITLVAEAAARLGFRKIRLTGGEPLARKGFPELVSMLAALPGIEKLAMTTNGTLLAPVAAELKARGLDSVNVSLDTLDPERYAALTRGGRLADAMAGVDAALAAGLPVKLNAVALEDALPGEHAALRAYAASVGADIQFIARYDLAEEKRDGGDYERPPKCGTCDRLRLLADGSLRPCLHGEVAVAVDWNDIEGSIREAVSLKPARGLTCTGLAVGQIGG
ncbi:MAG: radical SAM protein [Spirochaetaceae bacterium]|nr:radical SAM protein [Spirochaetaceae bacterium]